jgi:hypothetical protein
MVHHLCPDQAVCRPQANNPMIASRHREEGSTYTQSAPITAVAVAAVAIPSRQVTHVRRNGRLPPLGRHTHLDTNSKTYSVGDSVGGVALLPENARRSCALQATCELSVTFLLEREQVVAGGWLLVMRGGDQAGNLPGRHTSLLCHKYRGYPSMGMA